MDKLNLSRALKLLSAILVFGCAGNSFAAAQVSALGETAYVSAGASLGRSFTDYVRASVRDTTDSASFVHSLELPAVGQHAPTFDDLLLSGPEWLNSGGVAAAQTAAPEDNSREPNLLVMLLAAAGVVVYQLHRQQRSLEQRPLSTI